MLKRVILTIFCLSLTLNLVFAPWLAFCESQGRQDVRVEFEGRYWITDLDANAKVVESNVGEKFDFKSDLGIKDEDFPEGRVILNTGPNSRLRFAYTKVDYSGDKEVVRTVEFKGQTYTAGAQVKSELDITYLRFGWIWQFIDLWDGSLKLGSTIEAKAISADVSLDAPSLSISESEDFIAGLPTAGVTLDINPMKKVNLFAEISGFSAGDYGYFFDAEAGVKIIPFKNFSIIGGFRIIDIKAENGEDFVKVEITGPFLGATLRF